MAVGAQREATGARPSADRGATDGEGVEEALQRSRYQRTARRHLDAAVGRLFAEFTGLRFHVAWLSAASGDGDALRFPAGCEICRRLRGPHMGAACRACAPLRVARVLGRGSDGCRFTCHLGVRNGWFPIRVRGLVLGIAFVQALAHPEGARTPGGPRPRCDTGRDFDRAARLLRLIVKEVEWAELAELGAEDSARAQRALLEHEHEEARLRKELRRFLPVVEGRPAIACPHTHALQVARCLLELVHRRYDRPITLKGCAAELGMNASYLSDLFSQTIGIPFKAYLTELRLGRAKDLLGDPRRRVAEVAAAVGFASPDRFRLVFRQATGLPPRAWRETLLSA